MPRRRKFDDGFKERAVRLVAESGRPITHVAGDLGVGTESLRLWVRQAEADAGKQPAVLKTSERDELAKLRGEVKDLRRANDILKAASVFFAGGLDPRRSK
jgi:transposase